MLLLRLERSNAISCIDSGVLCFDGGGLSVSGPSYGYHMSSRRCSWATVHKKGGLASDPSFEVDEH